MKLTGQFFAALFFLLVMACMRQKEPPREPEKPLQMICIVGEVQSWTFTFKNLNREGNLLILEGENRSKVFYLMKMGEMCLVSEELKTNLKRKTEPSSIEKDDREFSS